MAAATIGALRVTLGANTAQYEAGLRRAQTQARMTGQSISRSFQDMHVRTVQSFGAMRVAAAGLGAALVGSTIVNAGRRALEFAANLGETSRQIGVTVEQLQILSRIALTTGVSQETLERSMAKLNRTLGEAKAGSRSAAAAFQALGFTREQINSWQQGGDGIRQIAERIMQIPDSARRAAAEVTLFGRAGQQVDVMLEELATSYDAAAAEAARMGLITEEQARKADEAKDAVDLLATSLQTQLAIALADNIQPVNDLIAALARLVSMIGSSLQALENFRSRATAVEGWMTERAGEAMLSSSLASAPFIGPVVRRAGERQIEQGRRMQMESRGNLANAHITESLSLRALQTRPPPTGDLDYQMPGGGGGRSRRGGGRDAEQARKEALRNEHEFNREMRRFQMDRLREEQQQVSDTILRGDLQAQVLDLERQQFIEDKDLEVALGDLTQARRDQLVAAYDQADEEERQTIALERRRTLFEERQQLDEQGYQIAADQLRQEADLADTAAERRDAELRLLDLTARYERAKLDAILAEEQTGSLAWQRARAERDALDQRMGAQRQSILRSTMGPLEQFGASLPTTAAKMNEALQSVAANGLQSIEDGLVDAIMGTKNLADAFADMAKSIIADLIRIQIQRMIIGPLTNVLSGLMPGGSAGVGGFDPMSFVAKAAGGGRLPGFASGGTIRVGGMSGVDRNLLSLNGSPIARVSQGEDINVGRRGNGDIVIHQSYRFDGVAVTREELISGLSVIKQDTIAAIRNTQRRAG